jgi:hypothetical protein
VNVSAHKTGLSALVSTNPTPTFISGGADLNLLVREPSVDPEVDRSQTAVTCDAKKTATAREMIPQVRDGACLGLYAGLEFHQIMMTTLGFISWKSVEESSVAFSCLGGVSFAAVSCIY